MNDKKQQKKIQRGLQIINKDFDLNIQLSNCKYGDKKPIHSNSNIYGDYGTTNEKCSINASKNVVIINGGLTTGLDEVLLMKIFNSNGIENLEQIYMIPGKQYSFVSFCSSDEAFKAVNNLSGKHLSEIERPLYMDCINEVPDLKTNVVYQSPPGLILIEEFITEQEEQILINSISWQSPASSSEGSTLKHREVRHYGYEFIYGCNTVDRNSPLEQKIPGDVQPICQRITDSKLMSQLPDQMTVNKYLPNQGIPPHVDTHQSFTGEILSLSLKAGITMDFYLNEQQENKDSALHYAVYLPRRSLCVMTGPSRYQWMHGIASRKTDVFPDPKSSKLTLLQREERISFTFRKTKEDGPCQCPYPKMCDSQLFCQEKDSLVFDAENAAALERLHVQDVYEEIAPHFSQTRHKPWPKVLEFVENLKKGSFLLDVGCGNGKYLGHNSGIYEMGCDTSLNLLKICTERNFQVAQNNCLNLSFCEESFDAVICIAVIHHLASLERRKKSVNEILRVLRKGGEALIYVWAFEQKMGSMSTYLKQMRCNRRKDKNPPLNASDPNLSLNIQSENSNFESLNLKPSREDNCIENVSSSSSKNSVIEPVMHDNKLLVHRNRTEFVAQDMFVPWKIKPEQFRKEKSEESDPLPVFHRFYHLFKQGELESIFEGIEGVEIVNSYYDEGNWCVVVKKMNTFYD